MYQREGTSGGRLRRVRRRPVWSVAIALLLTVVLHVDPGAVASADVDGPPLVDNGSFEAPDISAYAGTDAAVSERVRGTSFRGGHALAVTSSGRLGSGVTTRAVRDTDAGDHVLTLAVKGTASSLEQVVRTVIVDPATGERTTSAPVHLTPWWQTVGVTARTSRGQLRFEVRESTDGETWSAGDRYLVDVVDAGAAGPTTAATSGRQLIVDGEPFTMRGYYYAPTHPGGTIEGVTWNANPAQCQSDAQLLRTAGVNTLRISYAEVGYEPTTYRQCMDAFHAAGVRLVWLIQPPGGFQVQEDTEAYVELYWEHLRTAIERVGDHPATLGYNIGNEMKRQEPESNGWFDQLDELARRAEESDPEHVTTTSINHPQFFGHAGPGGDGVDPDDAPNVDLWGFNHYGFEHGYPDGIWQRIVDQDPTRPVWISEFGTDRYRCEQEPAGIFTPLYLFVCNTTSGEDQQPQAVWDAAQWNDIAANLSADDPDNAVVGGTLFMWSDLWWFSFPIFTGGVTTQATHEVTGLSGTNPVNGQPNHFVRNHFPDGHFSPEWIGVGHTLLLQDPGPRVTTAAYDRMGDLYSGTAGPEVGGATVAGVGSCSATVAWTTDVPTFSRVDFGRRATVLLGDGIAYDNFVADHTVQDDRLTTDHTVTLEGLAPGQPYRAYVRGFGPDGRSGSAPALEFTTATTTAGEGC